MYRNCSYILNENWEGIIVLDTWDEDGNPITLEYPHKSHLYYEDSTGTYNSIFDTKLKKVIFNSVVERKRWLEKYPSFRVFDCLPPVREFLIERFRDTHKTPEFTKYPLRTQFIDLEIKVENEFPNPEEATYPINVMTFYDNVLEKYFIWVCHDTEEFENYDDKIFFTFQSETEMLVDFVSWFKKNRPDIFTGWNIEKFDIPYLINRITNVLGPIESASLSPLNKIEKNNRSQRGELGSFVSYKIAGISILDYINLYKHKFAKGSKPSYKLGDVGEDELGYGKLEYEGTFKEFYRTDFRRFVEYNIRDVEVCIELDKKFKYINLARTICNIGLCEYESIFKSSPAIIGALTLEAKSQDKQLLSKKYDTGAEQTVSFTGAFVFDSLAGVYRNGIGYLDFNSLYPNIMISLNISPETKIGKIVESTQDYVILRLENGNIKKISPEKFESIKSSLVISANNILYINPTKKIGIMPSFLERLYEKRKKTKSDMIKLSKHISVMKAENEINVDSNFEKKLSKITFERDRLEMEQIAYKIFLNAIYGQMGNKYFPLFDIDNAEAVTLTGQKIIKESAIYIQSLLGENAIVSGDTDSVFIDIQKLVNDTFNSEQNIKWTDKNVKKIVKVFDEEFLPKVNKNCSDIMKREFNTPLKRIEFKREAFAPYGIFLCKKRYVLYIRDDEGSLVKKFKYTGVDIKKNEIPKKIKEFLRIIIEKSLLENDWDSSKYSKHITEIKNEFMKMDINDIAYIKNYATEKNSKGFLQLEKGSGIHAKAAVYHNQLIEKLGLTGKYNNLFKGDRIRYVYLQPTNEYGIEVIGWQDKFPEEFKGLFEIDYQKMFEKIVLAPMKRFEQVFHWGKVDPFSEVLTSIDSL